MCKYLNGMPSEQILSYTVRQKDTYHCWLAATLIVENILDNTPTPPRGITGDAATKKKQSEKYDRWYDCKMNVVSRSKAFTDYVLNYKRAYLGDDSLGVAVLTDADYKKPFKAGASGSLICGCLNEHFHLSSKLYQSAYIGKQTLTTKDAGAIIRAQIDAGEPVVLGTEIEMPNGNVYSHYTVAVGYIEKSSFIMFLDPNKSLSLIHKSKLENLGLKEIIYKK